MAKFDEIFKSHRHDYETPDVLFTPLDVEFLFTLDVCASSDNTKCDRFYTIDDNALELDWDGVCWMNPPFGDKKKWIEKAYQESLKGATVVCLIPARTNTNWWHTYCMSGEVRFIRGRPVFVGCEHGLPQPLAIVIFGPDIQAGTMSSWDKWKT